MSDKKKQHYIPRFYLKKFSLDESKKEIGIFNIDSCKFIPSGTLKNQAYGDYFYGRDLEIEDALGILESACAKVIKTIIDRQSVSSLTSQDYNTLMAFVLSLEGRTPYKVAQLNECADKFVKAAISKESLAAPYLDDVRFVMANPTQVALKNAVLALPLALDLDLKVAINNTQEPFITSDHPVILYNQFLEPRNKYTSNTGIACKGLEIFLPISPQLLLIFFDRDIYKVGNRKTTTIKVGNSNDVRALNLLQCISADKNIYFNNQISETQIRQMMNRAVRLRRKTKANIDEYVGLRTEKEARFLLHMYNSDLKCSLSLSFIHLLKKAKHYILGNTAYYLRNITICSLYEQFSAQVRKGRYKPTEFSKFLRSVPGLF